MAAALSSAAMSRLGSYLADGVAAVAEGLRVLVLSFLLASAGAVCVGDKGERESALWLYSSDSRKEAAFRNAA